MDAAQQATSGDPLILGIAAGLALAAYLFFLYWQYGRKWLQDRRYEKALQRYRTPKFGRDGVLPPAPKEKPFQWQPEQDFDVMESKNPHQPYAGDDPRSRPVLRKRLKNQKGQPIRRAGDK